MVPFVFLIVQAKYVVVDNNVDHNESDLWVGQNGSSESGIPFVCDLFELPFKIFIGV